MSGIVKICQVVSKSADQGLNIGGLSNDTTHMTII